MFSWFARPGKLTAILLIAIGLIAGATWAGFKLWPYSLLKQAREDWRFLQATNFLHRLEWALPNIHKSQGVSLHDRGRAYEGVTLMSGVFEEGVRLRLVDMDGGILHDWPIEFSEIWPSPHHIYPSTEIPTFRFGYTPFGFDAARDGSVVVVLENLGLVKMDRCGRVVWRLDRRVHHMLTPAGDGSFWVSAHRDAREVDQALDWPGRDPGTRGNVQFSSEYEDVLLHVAADGRVIREISVLKALLDGAPWHELYVGAGEFAPPEDPTHMNDVEIVTPELAARVRGAKAGDLLVSIRNLHMLAIISEDTGALVWRQVGPWVRQHDPDIEPTGRISVFDNHDHMGWAYNKEFGGSRVMLLDPGTGVSEITWPKTDEGFFYTRFMGAHQSLPNNNMLITESAYGRVFEMAPDGGIVWQFVEQIDETHAALIPLAQRYAPDFFQVSDWRCPGVGGS